MTFGDGGDKALACPGFKIRYKLEVIYKSIYK